MARPSCSACHDFGPSLKIKIGPPLWGVVGRKAACNLRL